jgi:hypothetical protein
MAPTEAPTNDSAGSLAARVRIAVRREMGERMMPAKALAGPLGVSEREARDLFKGRKNFTLDQVETLGNFFGTSLLAAANELRDAA